MCAPFTRAIMATDTALSAAERETADGLSRPSMWHARTSAKFLAGTPRVLAYLSCVLNARNAFAVSWQAFGNHTGADTAARGCHDGSRGDLRDGVSRGPFQRIGLVCRVVRAHAPGDRAVAAAFSMITIFAPTTSLCSHEVPAKDRDLSTNRTILVGRELETAWCALTRIRSRASDPAPGARHGAQSANMPAQVQSQGHPDEPISKPSGSGEYHCRKSESTLPGWAKRSVSSVRLPRSSATTPAGGRHP